MACSGHRSSFALIHHMSTTGRFSIVLRCLFVLALLAHRPASAATLERAIDGVSSKQLREYVEVLANDMFEGREAGSRGGMAAGNYLSQQYRKFELAGAGDQNSYFQAFNGASRNLLGQWPGSDPKLREQVVLLGAHYDHVGYGTSSTSNGPLGYIHNGADDNASGDAALLEVAKAIVQLEPRPKRTIVFALWDGEEHGLLGSKHWVAHPTIALNRVVCSINIDMVGRLRDDRLTIYGTRTSTGLRKLVSSQNGPSNLLLDFDWEIKADSDHYTFIEHSIPALMFHTGLHSDYHRPSDDADKINVAGMQRITRLMVGVVAALANEPSVGGFRPSARAENIQYKRQLEQSLPPLPSRLGITWDDKMGGRPGVKVLAVTPDSPAASAGLQAGDYIVGLEGLPVESAADLIPPVLAASGPVKLSIERTGVQKPLEVLVTLRGLPYRLGIAWREDVAEPSSLLICRVVPGTAADLAGVRVGDRINQVAGRSFRDGNEFQKLVTESGETLELLVERDGRERLLSLPIGRRPRGA
jgi:hypothetical protein